MALKNQKTVTEVLIVLYGSPKYGIIHSLPIFDQGWHPRRGNKDTFRVPALAFLTVGRYRGVHHAPCTWLLPLAIWAILSNNKTVAIGGAACLGHCCTRGTYNYHLCSYTTGNYTPGAGSKLHVHHSIILTPLHVGMSPQHLQHVHSTPKHNPFQCRCLHISNSEQSRDVLPCMVDPCNTSKLMHARREASLAELQDLFQRKYI